MFEALKTWVHKVATLKVATHQNEIRSNAMPDRLFADLKADAEEFEAKLKAAFERLGFPTLSLETPVEPEAPADETSPPIEPAAPTDTGTPGVEVPPAEATPVTPSEVPSNGPAQ